VLAVDEDMDTRRVAGRCGRQQGRLAELLLEPGVLLLEEIGSVESGELLGVDALELSELAIQFIIGNLIL